MNRKRSAVLAAVAIAAPLVTIVSTPASAAPGQFCQVNCYNSGYRYVLDKVVLGLEDGEAPGFSFPVEVRSAGNPEVDANPQTRRYFCDGPGFDADPEADLSLAERDLIDSLDADQAAASVNAAFSALTAGGELRITPRILTDSRGRPVGLSVLFDDDADGDGDGDLEDANGFGFQMVCLDDRDPVTP